MHYQYLAGLILVAGLSGCATTRDCDPRYDPGFFGSVNCHASDAYQGRIDEGKKILANEQELKQQLAQQSAEVEQAKQDTETALAQAQADLDGMEKELGDIGGALKQAGKANARLNRRIGQYQTDIKAMKAKVKKGNPQIAERDRLKRELAALQAAIPR
ncbi:hypothetical protein SAMN02949497_0897 [Methylomagnum ishizawai]|uniref:Lipoprotein n=1 Tax=Methylomagnum ishizawai TaxID=1760988 RepID=A0A1Y6CTU5_9GAMM|nr:hypothetical protein [Methylomagnum ishizawai]SMF93610.1 hypothetical protein SAMN02949497_0897 [Methylomagnum ishizawai]